MRNRQLGAQEVFSGYRKIAFDIELLWHVAELCSRRPANRSLVRYCADERPEQHRFAGAVRTNDRERSATGDGETEVGEDHRVVEADGEAIYLQDRTAKGCLLAGCAALWNLGRHHIQSDEGSGFASLIFIGSPQHSSVPAPALLQSTSVPHFSHK